jgi:spore cortex protein
MLAFPFSLVLAVGLSGCSTNESANKSEEILSTNGYETNEKDSLVRQINYNAPVPHLVDDYNEAEIIQENLEKNDKNPTVPRSEYGTGILFQDRNYSQNDRNYHGHESKPLKAKSSYYHAYEGELVEKLSNAAKKTNSVKDARALITQDEILVTVLLDDDNNAEIVKREVEKNIKPFSGKRKLHVVTDQGLYYRTMVLDNSLRDGGPRDQVILDTEDLFKNVSTHENHMK